MDLIIVGTTQVKGLINKHPQLLEIPTINAFQSTNKQALTPDKPCNCKVKVVNNLPVKSVTDLLQELSDQDYQQIKTIVGASRVCYYVRDPETSQHSKVCR